MIFLVILFFPLWKIGAASYFQQNYQDLEECMKALKQEKPADVVSIADFKQARSKLKKCAIKEVISEKELVILAFNEVMGAGEGIARFDMGTAILIKPHLKLSNHNKYSMAIYLVHKKYIILSARAVYRDWYYIQYLNIEQFISVL